MMRHTHVLWLRCVMLGLLLAGCMDRASLPVLTVPAAAEQPRQPASQPLVHPAQPVISYPATSFAPALSPDGDRLLFVSDRSGNLDIWLQPLDSATPVPPWQLTHDSATDTSPAWSPDGKQIAFTSHRSDPKGDILLLTIPRRAPTASRPLSTIRLTQLDTADSHPEWSPDGRFLVYTARKGPRQVENLWRIDLRDRSQQQVTTLGGNNAAFSPDGTSLIYTVSRPHTSHLWMMRWPDGQPRQLTSGAVIDSFSTWAHDGKRLFFTRYAEDTNRDGHVTIDDNPSIWRLDVSPSFVEASPAAMPPAIQLTTGHYYALAPTSGQERVYFTTNRLGHLGIWDISPEGLLPERENAAAQLELAQHIREVLTDDVRVQILAYKRVRQHFPNAAPEALAQSMYEAAVLYRRLGQTADARRTLETLQHDFPHVPLYNGLATIELVRLQATKDDSGQGALHEQLTKIVAQYPQHQRVQAGALLAQGDLALAQRATVQALQAYDRVQRDYPTLPQQQAEALYQKASIYALLQETDKVLNTYLAVLSQFPGVRDWGTRAAGDAIDLLLGKLEGVSALARLRELSTTYHHLPILPALAQRRIGDLHREREEPELATAAYHNVFQQFPKETEQGIAARFTLAEMTATAERYQPALAMYKLLMQKYPDDRATVRQARQRYIALTLHKAARERQQRDPRLALHTYTQLLAFAPQNIAAHRGAVQLQVELGEIAQAIQRYRRQVQRSPLDAASHYALGLAYTYTKPPRLRSAAQALQRAKTLAPQSLYIYQTLGFVYEQQGRQQQDTPLLELAVSSYQTALSLNAQKQDRSTQVNLLLNLGNAFYALENYPVAADYYRQRDAAHVPFPHPTTALLFHRHFGIAAFKSGALQESQQHLRQAILLATEAKQPQQQAELWDRLGLSYQEEGKYEDAVEAFAQALTLHREQGNAHRAHLSLRNLANNQFFLAQAEGEVPDPELLQDSLATYFASLESLQDYDPAQVQQDGDTGGGLLTFATTVSLSGDDSRAARGFNRQDEMKLIFTSIGRIYEELGDYDAARRYFRQKLALIPAKVSEAEKIPVLTEKALLLNQLGYFAYHQRDTEEALEHFHASLTTCREFQHVPCVVINQANIGRILAEMAATQPHAVSTAELQQALTAQKEALGVLDDHPNLSQRLYPFVLRNNAGMLSYHLARRFPRAVAAATPRQSVQETLKLWQHYHDHATQALAFFQTAAEQIPTISATGSQVNPARIAAVLYHNIAKVWQLLGQDNEAQAALQKALTLAETFYVVDLQWKIRLALADLHPAGAFATLQEAITHLEASPAVLALAPYDTNVLALLDRLYGRMLELLLQQQEFEQAYIYGERWQAQRTLAHLGDTVLQSIPFSHDVDQMLSAETRELVTQLRTLQTELATPTRVAAMLHVPQRPVTAADSGQSVAQTTTAASEAIDELRTRYTQTLATYQEFVGEMRQEYPELAALLTTTMVEPIEIQELLPQESVLVKYTLLPGKLLIWVIDQQHFISRIIPLPPTQLSAIVDRLRDTSDVATPDDLRQLATWLVEPITTYLQDKTRLYVLPDTTLLSIPWAALPQQDGVLIDSMQMSVVHSGHHLLQAQSKRSLYRERLLVVEDDAQGEPEPGWYTAAQDAAATLTVWRTGSEKKSHLLAQFPTHDLVHVGVPLIFNGAFPLQSSLRLGSSAQSSGRLNVRELYGVRTQATLMILTHVPSLPQSGEFLPLLDQSLLYAGFATVILHHGQPDAAYATAFLSVFYRHLKHTSAAAALRQTQHELRRQQPQHFGWARFQLYGYQGMSNAEQDDFAHQHYRDVLAEASSALNQQAWEQAATHLERAARLSRILQTDQALPVIYQRLTEAYRHVEQYDHAIAAQTRLLRLVEAHGTPAQVAETHRTLGIVYSDAEKFRHAVDHLQQAVSLQQQHGLTDELSQSYVTLGIAQERGAAYDDAITSFQRSLAVQQRLGRMEGVGEQLRRLGRIALLRLNDYAAAKEYFERALEIFRSAEHQPQRIEVLLELGRVYQQWGSFPFALDYFQQAAELAQTRDDKAVLAQAHIDQANVFWLRGDYQQAFNHQRRAARLATAADAGFQQLQAANTLGLIYWTLNDFERARQQQHEALRLARELKRKDEEATVYNNMGTIDRQQKRYDEAIESFTRALALDVALKSLWGQAYAHRNLGMTYLHKEELDRAQSHLENAVRMSRAIGDRTNTAKSLLSLGDTALARGALPDAAQTYQLALTLARTVGLPEVEWRVLYGLGRLHRASGQVPQAITVLQQAITVVETLRAAIKVEEFRNGFINDKLDVYQDLIFLLLDQGKPVEAFNFAERARARSFIDLLGNQRISLESVVSQDLFETHQRLRDRLYQKQQELLQAPPSRQPDLRQELLTLNHKYQDLLIELKSANPQLSNFVSVDPLTLSDVQRLLEPQVALVEYLVGTQQTLIWAVTRDSLTVERVDIGKQELNTLVQEYRVRLQQVLPIDAQAQKLYDLLLRPVASTLAPSRYVGIIPHDILHYLPFSSLHDGTRFMLDAYALFSAPSASSLRYTFAKRRQRPKNTKVLAVGNPQLGTMNYDLPLAEKEVHSLRWPFPDITTLTRDKALESWIVEHIADYGIVHIASHGQFDSVNPLFSSLKLARDRQADGNLDVREIFGLNIQADLVTLSACQTGLGAILDGDELIGLNRAFIYAGTHAIISSLWRIDDLASAILMKHFYRFYTRAGKADSLRQAQVTIRQQFAHPSYWAGFVLTGDYD